MQRLLIFVRNLPEYRVRQKQDFRNVTEYACHFDNQALIPGFHQQVLFYRNPERKGLPFEREGNFVSHLPGWSVAGFQSGATACSAICLLPRRTSLFPTLP
jgi:hypothetical protein